MQLLTNGSRDGDNAVTRAAFPTLCLSPDFCFPAAQRNPREAGMPGSFFGRRQQLNWKDDASTCIRSLSKK